VAGTDGPRTPPDDPDAGGDPACWAHLFDEPDEHHATPTVWTVGHGTLAADELMSLLGSVPIRRLVDIRSYPGSRRNPQFGREEMERWVPAAGIDYRWLRDLGGRRRPSPASRHVALRHEAFRAYADHMDSPAFASGVDELLDLAAAEPTAVMCSESVWWRCHRRLLADHLALVRRVRVVHVMHDGRLVEHPPTDGVRLDADGRLAYDVVDTTADQPQLPL
jgi:uncharacterized protein (DUF488 family)